MTDVAAWLITIGYTVVTLLIGIVIGFVLGGAASVAHYDRILEKAGYRIRVEKVERVEEVRP